MKWKFCIFYLFIFFMKAIILFKGKLFLFRIIYCSVLSDFCRNLDTTLQYSRSPFRSTKNQGLCASRLCKAAFLFRFRELGRILNHRDMASAPNYFQAKSLAEDYQEVKQKFRHFTHKMGLGHWIQMPKEISMFDK